MSDLINVSSAMDSYFKQINCQVQYMATEKTTNYTRPNKRKYVNVKM